MAIYSATVAAPAAFAAKTAPDVTLPFTPKRVTIINNDPAVANYVEFSFEGNAADTIVHGRVTPTVNPVYESRQDIAKIWLKRAAGAPNITIIAES